MSHMKEEEVGAEEGEEESTEMKGIVKRLENVFRRLERLAEEKGTREEKRGVRQLENELEEIKETKSRELIGDLTRKASQLIDDIRSREEEPTGEELEGNKAEKMEKAEEMGVPQEEAGEPMVEGLGEKEPPEKLEDVQETEKTEEMGIKAEKKEKQEVKTSKWKGEADEFSGGLERIRASLKDTLVMPEGSKPSKESVKEAGEIIEAVEEGEKGIEVKTQVELSKAVDSLQEDVKGFKQYFRQELKSLKKQLSALATNLHKIRAKLPKEPAKVRKTEEKEREEEIEERMREEEQEVKEKLSEKVKRIQKIFNTEPESSILRAIELESVRVSFRDLLRRVPDEQIPKQKSEKMQRILQKLEERSQEYQSQLAERVM